MVRGEGMNLLRIILSLLYAKKRCPEKTAFFHDVDRIIAAIGQKGDYSFLPSDIAGKIAERGKIKVNEDTGMTSIEGIFAGGDAVNRVMDAVSAIGDGLRAVKGIDEYLSEK